ncbi:hypothetical protein R3P38DRAFT_284656 [Favolaschia claudopus]|uniref:GATA-type domain-containing protein n=1 Tax=Favolaschia claudopus TaxID=2862362 RepID=A0AAV9ZNW1_9AGAR
MNSLYRSQLKRFQALRSPFSSPGSSTSSPSDFSSLSEGSGEKQCADRVTAVIDRTFTTLPGPHILDEYRSLPTSSSFDALESSSIDTPLAQCNPSERIDASLPLPLPLPYPNSHDDCTPRASSSSTINFLPWATNCSVATGSPEPVCPSLRSPFLTVSPSLISHGSNHAEVGEDSSSISGSFNPPSQSQSTEAAISYNTFGSVPWRDDETDFVYPCLDPPAGLWPASTLDENQWSSASHAEDLEGRTRFQPEWSGFLDSLPLSPLPFTDEGGHGFRCAHCNATFSPVWRLDPVRGTRMCNACALYLSRNGRMRPLQRVGELVNHKTDDERKWCTHCHRYRPRQGGRGKRTDIWICGACAQYQRKKGSPRPEEMFNNEYKPRISRQQE